MNENQLNGRLKVTLGLIFSKEDSNYKDNCYNISCVGIGPVYFLKNQYLETHIREKKANVSTKNGGSPLSNNKY